METIVVDDGSTDGTAAILSSAAQADRSIVIITNEKTRGYGASLKRGFQAAKGDLIAFLDMDDTYDPRLLVRFAEIIHSGSVGIVSGDRLSLKTEMPLIRKIGNRFFVITIQTLFGRQVLDCCSGMRMFHSKYRDEFCSLPTDELNFSLAMTLQCLSNGIEVREIPIEYAERIGDSKLKVVSDGILFMTSILRAWSRFHASRARQAFARF